MRPVPATRVSVPLASTLKTLANKPLLKYRLPAASVATPYVQPTDAAVAGTGVGGGTPPATVVITNAGTAGVPPAPVVNDQVAELLPPAASFATTYQ